MKLSWHVAGYGTLALVLAGAVFAYERTKQDLIRSNSVQQAQAAVQKQLSEQIADLEKQVADRDTTYQKSLAGLESRFQKAATPQQLAKLIGDAMGLKAPIEINTPAPTPANPHPQPVAVVPLVDAPEAKAYVAACEACKFTVPKLQADLADREKQMALAQKEIDSLKLQRDAAVQASKGGSWLRRLKHDKTVAIIGGAIGVAAVCATGHCSK